MWARALAYQQFGGPEVLELIDTWVPEPGPGQLRVKVRAGGLNPIDGKLRAGDFSAGLPVLAPTRLGSTSKGANHGRPFGIGQKPVEMACSSGSNRGHGRTLPPSPSPTRHYFSQFRHRDVSSFRPVPKP